MNKKYTKLFIISGYVFLSAVLWWYCNEKSFIGIDDANIYMVYMRNFADGHGFVFNIGSERVEGFTSLLWALIGGLFYKISARPEICLLVFNFILITYALWKLVCFTDDYFKDRRLITPYSFLLLGLLEMVPGYFDWTILSLMETGLWSTLLILMALNIFKWETDENSRKSPVSFIVLMILLIVTRPESYLWGMIFIFIRTTQIYRTNGGKMGGVVKNSLPLITAFAGTIGLLTAWRLSYFGYAFPNTYYAKVSSNFMQNLMDGFKYDAFYFIWCNMLAIVVLFLGGAITLKMIRRKAEVSFIFLYSFLFTLVTIGIPLYSGGDHFANGRFIQPTVPLIWLCFIWCIDFIKSDSRKLNPYIVTSAFLLFLAFSPIYSAYNLIYKKSSLVSGEFALAIRERENSVKLNSFFKEQGKLPSQGVIAAGGSAYSYNGFTNDMMGLNNTEMAHAEKNKGKNPIKSHASFNKGVFYRQQPDLLWLRGRFIDSDSITPGYELKLVRFFAKAFKDIHMDQKFQDAYSKVAIFKKNEKECLTIFAKKDFLNRLNPDYYTYRILK